MKENVDEFWFQISGSIAQIEALFEDEEFTHRELAALVASKASSLSMTRDCCSSSSHTCSSSSGNSSIRDHNRIGINSNYAALLRHA